MRSRSQIVKDIVWQINALLRRAGVQLVPAGSMTEAQKHLGSRRHTGSGVSSEDRAALVQDNPELIDLVKRYNVVSSVMGQPLLWTADHIKPEDLLFFRGDNAYVWQWHDNNNEANYLVTCFYIKQIDHLGLLDILHEDGNFGVFVFTFYDDDGLQNRKLISRDLLDSVNEILFLDRTLQIISSDNMSILDIGAGYGRLAHRMVTAASNIQNYYCIDAIPQSTFICRYYLDHKNISEKANVIPFDQQAILNNAEKIKLAINIHSFSEMPLAAVEYWIKRCVELDIEYLFIVPDMSADGGERLLLVDGTDFRPVLTRHGYELRHAEPKYRRPEVQRCGVSPAWYYLFRLKSFTRQEPDQEPPRDGWVLPGPDDSAPRADAKRDHALDDERRGHPQKFVREHSRS